MDILIEFLLELILEGTMELGTNRKVPKYIRYPLFVVIVLFFLSIIGLLIFLGTNIAKDSLLLGLFVIVVAIILAVGLCYRYVKEYRRFKDGE